MKIAKEPQLTAAEARAKAQQLAVRVGVLEADARNYLRDRTALADRIASAERQRDEHLASWRRCDKERKRLEAQHSAALTAIAAFNLNGVAPRDKLGAALDCIAAVRKALEDA